MKAILTAAMLALIASIATPADAFSGGAGGGSIAQFRSIKGSGTATVRVNPERFGCFTVLHATRHAPFGVHAPQHVVPLTLTVAPGYDCRPGRAIYATSVFANTAQFGVKLYYVDQRGRFIGSEQITIRNR